VDVLVIAPEFDESYSKSRVDSLWTLRAQTDSRIEPIGVGCVGYNVAPVVGRRRDASVIIEMARREG
jgi:hypothetical protein